MSGRRFHTLVPLFLLGLTVRLPALSDFSWEQPQVLSSRAGNFPVSAYNDNLAVAAWQEKEILETNGEAEGLTRISIAVKKAGGPWRVRDSVGGPYTYTGEEPPILSAAVDSRDRLLIAAASASRIEILISENQGESFQLVDLSSGAEPAAAPRLFTRAGGGFLLFVTKGGDPYPVMYYARSDDGAAWSPFEPFPGASPLSLDLPPVHASLDGTEYVVFQSFMGEAGAVSASHLFMRSSTDGGLSWTETRLLADLETPDTGAGNSASELFDNRRPHLSVQDGRLFLVWERRSASGISGIYGAFLGENGAFLGPAERIDAGEGGGNNPIAFSYENEIGLVWIGGAQDAVRVFLARRSSGVWWNDSVDGAGGEALLARPAVSGGGLFLFLPGKDRRIYVLARDTQTAAPQLKAENFTPQRRNAGERVKISWTMPQGFSGIRGFAYCWSQADTEKWISAGKETTAVEEIASQDGSWYFSLKAQDSGGNWSPVSRIEYIRDTVPPPAPEIIPPELDEAGCLLSSTFSLHWNPSSAPDIAGYTWNLEYLGPASPFASLDDHAFNAAVAARFTRRAALPPENMGAEPSASFTNRDDGVWRFSVAGIDEAGNIGPSSSLSIRTNKYIPQTVIASVDCSQDEQGVLSIRIIGRGFTSAGTVTTLFFDRDGLPPYDREYALSEGDCRVLSDREITAKIEDLDPGLYRVGLVHPLRGPEQTEPLVTVDEKGTVKTGDYTGAWKPSWTIRPGRPFVLDTVSVIIMGIILFSGLGLAAALRGAGAVLAEGAIIKAETAALIAGDLMPLEKKRRLARIRRRGMGLRLKLASFTIVLVILVVAMVSLPLYLMMTQTQEETLFSGLRDRSTVLMEGLASGARAYLPQGNIQELSYLPDQITAVPEVRYVTITGYNTSERTYNDIVWATNDPDILDKIDTVEFHPGFSRLADVLSPKIEILAEELNSQARIAVDGLSSSITSLTQETLDLSANTEAENVQRLLDVRLSLRTLETRLNERLSEISHDIGSEPAFSPESGILGGAEGGRRFIFFKPVMYRQGSDDSYFRGLVRLEISTDIIADQIAGAQRQVLRVILMVALTALAIGATGALALSTLLIGPIRKLVSHVELIRDTEDKARLEGVDITIRSRDELAVLGSTINDMTRGLVKAAQAASDLTIGKEFQKKFIPLDLDREGNKLTIGSKETKNAEFFGYYEGAKGVSGDYFDYQELDRGRYYAIIKCDVAGKGVPAALLMIQVATMFLNYCKSWKPTAKGMRIEEVVYQINAFIEALGFKGRFAAFTLALLDTHTGLIRFCNAGDNIIHWFDASERKMKTLTLPETPAAGVLPNFLVETKGGYTVQTLTLGRGDILFLYTDGIEEAKRKFRDAKFREILCAEGEEGTVHANHTAGQGNEELGADRVEAIINAVMNRQVYHLSKYHNGEGGLPLRFDFSTCEGRVEEAIMAMVSVEKIFRLYKVPGITGDNKVLVDKKVDVFLKEHFLEYRKYCQDSQEIHANSIYMYYTQVNEDPQYDDLTIIGIKRK